MAWDFYTSDGQILQGILAGATITTPIITEIDSGSTITLDAVGDLVLDAGGADIFLKDDGTTFGSLNQTGGELRILSGSTPTLAATFAGANVTLAGTVGSGAITSTGVITGLTVEATGDTAADDNAAIGYTAAEGLILTGQGSTNDITIKNDADAAVISIPTGTTNVTFAGNITVNGTTTTVDSTTLTVVDPIIHLQTATGGGALAADSNKDVGLIMQYHNGSAAKSAFLGFDDSDSKLMYIADATLSGGEVITNPTALGTIKANIEAATLGVTGVTTIRTIAYTWPAADASTSGDTLTSNAGGTLAWTTPSAGVGLGMVIALGG
jgi:hypothetical protein